MGRVRPARLLHRLGAHHDAGGWPRRPDGAAFTRVLGDRRHEQQVDDVLCAWAAARARDLRPGLRRRLRVDGKALRGAARGGRAPMLLSGIWDDGTTAALLPVNTAKENEIPVFRDLLDKIPGLYRRPGLPGDCRRIPFVTVWCARYSRAPGAGQADSLVGGPSTPRQDHLMTSLAICHAPRRPPKQHWTLKANQGPMQKGTAAHGPPTPSETALTCDAKEPAEHGSGTYRPKPGGTSRICQKSP